MPKNYPHITDPEMLKSIDQTKKSIGCDTREGMDKLVSALEEFVSMPRRRLVEFGIVYPENKEERAARKAFLDASA